MLKPYVNEGRNDWDNHIPYLCMAYWATVHESIQFTPNILMLGRDVNLPVDVMVGKLPVPYTAPCYVQYVEWVSHATEQAFAHARDSLRAAAERRKRNFDVGVKLMTFNEGFLVWFYYSPRKSKLGVPWIGPFRVR